VEGVRNKEGFGLVILSYPKSKCLSPRRNISCATSPILLQHVKVSTLDWKMHVCPLRSFFLDYIIACKTTTFFCYCTHINLLLFNPFKNTLTELFLETTLKNIFPIECLLRSIVLLKMFVQADTKKPNFGVLQINKIE